MREEKEDGWIEWSGGEQPVSDQTRVNVRFRDGNIWENERADVMFDSLARSFWEHEPGDQVPSDIIAYRIVEPRP